MTTTKQAFTQRFLESIPLPAEGDRAVYHDTQVKGLTLRVTHLGRKTFTVYKKVNGKPVRFALGTFPDMSATEARAQAMEALSRMARGVNPHDERKAREAKEITLRTAFEDYVRSRKHLKASTVGDYRKAMLMVCPDWLDRPLANITKEKVRRRHDEFGKRSQARANNAMRVLRAVFNFAAEVYEGKDGVSYFPANPVVVLSKTKAWHRVGRRTTYITKQHLPAWFDAVMALASDHPQSKAAVVREYLLFILFTGTRREEAASLKWADVDLTERTFTLRDTKNRETVTLPLCRFLAARLSEWRIVAPDAHVFPSLESKGGYIVSPHRQLTHVAKASGVSFTIHDLRRTFITLAESLDISSYTVKRLVNHKTVESQDVTAGYVVTDIERLRSASERVAATILGNVGARLPADVVPMVAGRQVA
jgi:integrase